MLNTGHRPKNKNININININKKDMSYKEGNYGKD